MNNTFPFVSVVMPVRNEGAFIRESLGSVLNQDYPRHLMEIIVADGMSTDNTRAVISEYQKSNPNIILIDNPQHIVAPGLNAAIQRAKGDIIIRADGHCEIAPDYVRQCVQLLQGSQWDVVGGPIETIGETALAKTIAVAMSSWFGVGGSKFRTLKDRDTEADTVPFPAYKREIFSKAGLFDEELVRNQDDEHNYRIRKMGGKVFLSSKIKSRYHSRGTLKSLWRQYFQYGFWKVRVMQKHLRQISFRQLVPGLFVSALMACLVLSLFLKEFLFLFLSIFSCYVFVSLCASLCSASSLGQTVRLPVIYAILHFGYGCGFLIGLIKFRNRWKT